MPDHPPGYTQEEWDSYLRDPCSWCIRELGGVDRDVRENAADILRGLGRDAERALPFLVAHFQDDDRGVRLACMHAVGEIVGATGAGGEVCSRALGERGSLTQGPADGIDHGSGFRVNYPSKASIF